MSFDHHRRLGGEQCLKLESHVKAVARFIEGSNVYSRLVERI